MKYSIVELTHDDGEKFYAIRRHWFFGGGFADLEDLKQKRKRIDHYHKDINVPSWCIHKSLTHIEKLVESYNKYFNQTTKIKKVKTIKL